ncbi:N-acyltransferase NodA [Bradyrhizobium sp. LM3.4]
MNMIASGSTRGVSARPPVRWRLCWENELQLADHIELSDFFRKTYGPTGAFNAQPFEGHRSWAGARPEIRAIGYDDRGVAIHIGALRRFIKVGEVDLLVAELGLYGVRPDLEGLGISHSIRVMYPVLRDLGVAVRLWHGPIRPAETYYQAARATGVSDCSARAPCPVRSSGYLSHCASDARGGGGRPRPADCEANERMAGR